MNWIFCVGSTTIFLLCFWFLLFILETNRPVGFFWRLLWFGSLCDWRLLLCFLFILLIFLFYLIYFLRFRVFRNEKLGWIDRIFVSNVKKIGEEGFYILPSFGRYLKVVHTQLIRLRQCLLLRHLPIPFKINLIPDQ